MADPLALLAQAIADQIWGELIERDPSGDNVDRPPHPARDAHRGVGGTVADEAGATDEPGGQA